MFYALGDLIEAFAISKRFKKLITNWKFKRREVFDGPWYSLKIEPPWNFLRNCNTSGLSGNVKFDWKEIKEAKEWSNLLESWQFERPDPNLESSKWLSSGNSAYKYKKMSTHFWGFRHRETSNQQRKFNKLKTFWKFKHKEVVFKSHWYSW